MSGSKSTASDPLLRVTIGFAPNYNAINLSNSTINGSSSVVCDESTATPPTCNNGNNASSHKPSHLVHERCLCLIMPLERRLTPVLVSVSL